ncbi:LamG domain-containing protein [Candidatus Dojkabacteria bacterium]|nr:LamG domain-containing protein [Candidatus Dojkabacteria bacterium]
MVIGPTHSTPTGTTVVNGFSGKARNFNGTSDKILCAFSPTTGIGSFSIFSWIKTSTTGARRSIIMYGAATTNNGVFLFQNASNQIEMDLSVIGGPSSTVTITDGKWHYVGAVNNAGTVQIYVDGAASGSSVAMTPNIGSSSNCAIGADVVNNTYYFSGTIDEVQVSNVARSAEQIAEAYRAGRNHYINKTITSTDLSSKISLPFYIAADRPGTYLSATVGESAFANYQTDTNTVGLWHLEEQAGTGAYFKDSSGNGNNASIGGGTTTFTQGQIGKARSFNGSSDFLTLGTNVLGTQLNGSSAATIETWFNLSTLPATSATSSLLSSFINSTSNGLAMGIYNNAGTYQLKLSTRSVSADTLQTVYTNLPSLATGQWHYFVGVIDFTGKTVKTYYNGRLLSTTSVTLGNNTYTQGTATSIDTMGNSSGTNFWNGLIDEFRISKTARTDDQIRQAFEVGARTHPITIDFGAKLDSGNLITSTSDLGFTVDATYYGLNAMGSNMYLGDKIIVKENYDGTEYIAQGTVNAITTSTGATTVTAWDTGSTAPSGGFTVNASVFKWQREYFDIHNILSTQKDGITNITLRLTDGNEGRTIWLDDFKSTSGYMSNSAGTAITSSTGDRYFQYRAITTSSDTNVSPNFTSVTTDYVSNYPPNTPSLLTPSSGATGVTLPLAFTISATDNDGDYLQYKIEMCDDLAMSVSCITPIDQSLSQTGWSGQDADGGTAYISGHTATYTTSNLTLGHTYYWRTYALDPDGINSWSGTQTARSFTVNQKPNTPSYGSPSDTATGLLMPLALTTSATDTDSNDLQYKMDVCTDLAMTTGCITGINQTLSQTGWSGQDAGGGTSYITGHTATYTTSALTYGQTYYWRTYAIDPTGSNTWSDTQSTLRSFEMNHYPDAPTSILTNGATNPINVTTPTPTFSAIYADYDSENSASYQVEVNTAADFTGTVMWDSTKQSMTVVSGARSSNITYAGTALPFDGSTFYVRIKFWDINDFGGPWSTETASFTTKKGESVTGCYLSKATDSSSITVIWRDTTSFEDGYQIQKKIDAGAFTDLYKAATNATSYADSSVSLGHTYTYRIAYTNGGYTGSWCTTNPEAMFAGGIQIY